MCCLKTHRCRIYLVKLSYNKYLMLVLLDKQVQYIINLLNNCFNVFTVKPYDHILRDVTATRIIIHVIAVIIFYQFTQPQTFLCKKPASCSTSTTTSPIMKSSAIFCCLRCFRFCLRDTANILMLCCDCVVVDFFVLCGEFLPLVLEV